MIDIAIITAPRLKPTVNKMLQGFKFLANRPSKIHLFAEPNTKLDAFDFVVLHQNEEKKGCFNNFDQAYRWILDNGSSKYVLVLSDDVKFKGSWVNKAIKYAEEIGDFGYIALYTPHGMKFAFKNNPRNEVIKFNAGYARGSWGGLYLIRRDRLESILDHDFYLNHKKTHKDNTQFDECMKQTCLELGYDQYYINPSLFDHVGKTSTIGHSYRTIDRGLNYERS